MTDLAKFELFTISIGTINGQRQIAIVISSSLGGDPAGTMVSWFNAPNARSLAADLIKLADILDPPPQQLPEKTPEWAVVKPPLDLVPGSASSFPKKRGRPFGKKRKAKRGKR